MHSPPVTHHWFFSHRSVDREQINTNTRDVGDVMKNRVYVLGAVKFNSELTETLNTHARHASHNHNVPRLSRHTVKHIARVARHMYTRTTIGNPYLTTGGTR